MTVIVTKTHWVDPAYNVLMLDQEGRIVRSEYGFASNEEAEVVAQSWKDEVAQ